MPLEQRIFLLKVYMETGKNEETIRQFALKFPDVQQPANSTPKRLLDRFKATGSVEDTPYKTRKKTVSYYGTYITMYVLPPFGNN